MVVPGLSGGGASVVVNCRWQGIGANITALSAASAGRVRGSNTVVIPNSPNFPIKVRRNAKCMGGGFM